MWSSALYGIGVGDGEIVVVALSQLGNVGGQPYWSWYGFNSRVADAAPMVYVNDTPNSTVIATNIFLVSTFAGIRTNQKWNG